MNIIAEIEGLHLQPIAFPAGWKLIRNMFYAIDPDDDLSNRKLRFRSIDVCEISDPWNDVVCQYFYCSYHWIAMRNDNLREITLDYPMGQRGEQFRLREYHHKPLKFKETPKQRIERNHENAKLTYALVPPIEEPLREAFDSPNREFFSNRREVIVRQLEHWLIES